MIWIKCMTKWYNTIIAKIPSQRAPKREMRRYLCEGLLGEDVLHTKKIQWNKPIEYLPFLVSNLITAIFRYFRK